MVVGVVTPRGGREQAICPRPCSQRLAQTSGLFEMHGRHPFRRLVQPVDHVEGRPRWAIEGTCPTSSQISSKFEPENPSAGRVLLPYASWKQPGNLRHNPRSPPMAKPRNLRHNPAGPAPHPDRIGYTLDTAMAFPGELGVELQGMGKRNDTEHVHWCSIG
jgi:hypothetical protein